MAVETRGSDNGTSTLVGPEVRNGGDDVIAHDVRGHLHAALLHLTFLQRRFSASHEDSEIVEAVTSAAAELRQLGKLMLTHGLFDTRHTGEVS